MLIKKKSIFFVLVLLTCWLAIVVSSGAGWNPFGVPWDFGNTGSFGDSFGPLGALMAALAALAAFETLHEQRKELERIRLREAAEDVRREQEARDQSKREQLRDLAASKAAFEGTFFKLLDALRDVVKDTDVGVGDTQKSSRDAFQRMCSFVVTRYKYNNDLDKSWKELVSKYKNDLNHYFRLMYHIIKYVDSQKGIDRYFYVRLVRASLSEAEMILLFVNCAVGEGKYKFRPLVEKYALLHNVSQESRDGWEMDKHIGRTAFEREGKDLRD